MQLVIDQIEKEKAKLQEGQLFRWLSREDVDGWQRLSFTPSMLYLDDELKYFGRIHYEEEFGHSVQARDLAGHEMSDELFALTQKTVTELFADYSDLFDCWYRHVGKYERHGDKTLGLAR